MDIFFLFFSSVLKFKHLLKKKLDIVIYVVRRSVCPSVRLPDSLAMQTPLSFSEQTFFWIFSIDNGV